MDIVELMCRRAVGPESGARVELGPFIMGQARCGVIDQVEQLWDEN